FGKFSAFFVVRLLSPTQVASQQPSKRNCQRKYSTLSHKRALLCALSLALLRSIRSHLVNKLLYDFSTAFSSEVLIKIVENRAPPLQADLIIFVSHCDAGDEPLDPNRVLPPELRILEIDVVNNLSDRDKRRVIETYA